MERLWVRIRAETTNCIFYIYVSFVWLDRNVLVHSVTTPKSTFYSIFKKEIEKKQFLIDGNSFFFPDVT